MRLGTFLFEDLSPEVFHESMIGERLTGRSVLTRMICELVGTHHLVDEFALFAAGDPHVPYLTYRLVDSMTSWAQRSRVVWFEPARHYWWRPALLRGSGLRFPIVTMMHSIGYSHQIGPLLTSLALGCEEGDVVISPSRAAANVLRSHCDVLRDVLGWPLRVPAVQVVPYGVRAPISCPGGYTVARGMLGYGEEPVIFFLGRIREDDKADFFALLESAVRWKAGGRAFRLVLAGAGTPGSDKRLLAAIRQCGLAAEAEVRLNVSEAEKAVLLRACDVFVSPSNTVSESFGLSVVEAMMHGKPVVCSNWSGYREIVRDGVDGFLVDTWWNGEDDMRLDLPFALGLVPSMSHKVALDIAELSGAVGRLMDDPALRRRMGESAERRARAEFEIGVVVDDIVNVCMRSQREYAYDSPVVAHRPCYGVATAFRAYAQHVWCAASGAVRDPFGDALAGTGMDADYRKKDRAALDGVLGGGADSADRAAQVFRLIRKGVLRAVPQGPCDREGVEG